MSPTKGFRNFTFQFHLEVLGSLVWIYLEIVPMVWEEKLKAVGSNQATAHMPQIFYRLPCYCNESINQISDYFVLGVNALNTLF